MTTNVGFIESLDENLRRDFLKALIKKDKDGWLILSYDDYSDLTGYADFTVIEPHNLRMISLYSFKYIWLDQWPVIAEREEDLYHLWSHHFYYLFFTTSHDYPFKKNFLKKWSVEGIQFSNIIKEELYSCSIVASRKLLREFSYARQDQDVSFSIKSDLALNPWIYARCSGRKDIYFYHSQAPFFNLFTLWWMGRQSPRRMISFKNHGNKSRRYSYSKDSISRSSLDRRAAAA